MMAAVRSKNTRPEMALRSALHGRGLRYRLHPKNVPGKPDIAWQGLRIAVFVDGDFWHGNAWRVRGLADPRDQFPTNADWWMAKMARNRERDTEVNRRLRESGWTVLRIWESDIVADLASAADHVVQEVRDARLKKATRVRLRLAR